MVDINPSGLRRDPKTIQIKWQLVNQDKGEKQVDECCQSSRLKSLSSWTEEDSDKRWNIFKKLKEVQVNFPKTEFWSSSCCTLITPRTEALRSVSLSSCVPDRNYLFLICYPDLNLTTLWELQRTSDRVMDEKMNGGNKKGRTCHSFFTVSIWPSHSYSRAQTEIWWVPSESHGVDYMSKDDLLWGDKIWTAVWKALICGQDVL